MRSINYNDRYFKSVLNSPNGEVDEQTTFHYRQQESIIWATYSGGAIQFGTLVGYSTYMTGKCRSTLTILPDGRYHLDESWQWTSSDGSSGQSAIEEIMSEE